MSVLEQALRQDGCLQCWADNVLLFAPADLENEMERQFRADPRFIMVGQPSSEDMALIVRSGRRECRLVARLALMEPHECGKDSPK